MPQMRPGCALGVATARDGGVMDTDLAHEEADARCRGCGQYHVKCKSQQEAEEILHIFYQAALTGERLGVAEQRYAEWMLK
jgi:hypothetical protein